MTDEAPRPLTRNALAALLGVHLAEVEARLDEWGSEIQRRLKTRDGVPLSGLGLPPAPEMPPHTTPGIEEVSVTPAAPPLRSFSAPAIQPARFEPKAHHRWTAGDVCSWYLVGRVETLEPARLVAVESELRLVSEDVGVEPDTMHELTLAGMLPPRSRRLRILVQDPGVGIDLACRDLRGAEGARFLERIAFRTLHRSQRLRLRLEVSDLRPGEGIGLDTIALDRIGGCFDLAAAQARDVVAGLPMASMATVTGREEMLLDAVSGLLGQAGRICVFLNGHTNAPGLLDHPRIELAWSRDHDDLGDAGKFFWAEDPQPGPRLVVDDDFVFPPDLTERLRGRLAHYKRKAVVGVHGIVLRQPIQAYYGLHARHVVRYTAGNPRDLPCHTVGTGAICYDPATLRLERRAFPFPNMADVWLMLEAARQDVPVIAMRRPHSWLIENRATQPTPSIYGGSSTGSADRFDTARMQSHVVRGAWPVSLPRRGVSKIVLVLDGRVSVGRALASIDAWFPLSDPGVDWVLAILLGRAEDQAELLAGIAERRVPHEVHVITPPQAAQRAALPDLIGLLGRIPFDAACLLSDGASLDRAAWAALPARVSAVGSQILLLRDEAGRFAGLAGGVLAQQRLAGRPLRSPSSAAPLAETLAAWALAAGLARPEVLPGAISALPMPEPAPPPFHGRVLDRRGRVPGMLTMNGCFGRVLLLGAESRPDRLPAFEAAAGRAGLRYECAPTMDTAALRAEWKTYAISPLRAFPAGTGPLRSERDFYDRYLNSAQRVAHVEQQDGRKAVGLAAWAQLRTVIAVLTRAIEEDWGSMLLLDVGLHFHRNLGSEFDWIMQQVPRDWMVLSLGVRQLSWEEASIRLRGESLYHCRGTSLGAHAVALRRDAYPALLSAAMRMDLPFDVGALHALKRAWWQRCLVFRPNLFIPVDEAPAGWQPGDYDLR